MVCEILRKINSQKEQKKNATSKRAYDKRKEPESILMKDALKRIHWLNDTKLAL